MFETDFISKNSISHLQEGEDGTLEIVVNDGKIYHCFNGGFTTESDGLHGNFELKKL